MHKLTPIDLAFLLAERPHQPLHVGALSVFRPPEPATPAFVAKLVDRLRDSQQVAPPFDRQLVQRLGFARWTAADGFDLSQHFAHLTLPRPGGFAELQAMVSRIHSAHLDRAYPLWHSYLIDGLADGRIALYSKIHHALVDGVAGIRIMLRSMSADARTSVGMPPPWNPQRTGSKAGTQPTSAPPARPAPALGLKAGLRGTSVVLRQVLKSVRDIGSGSTDAISSFQAPRCLLNQPISGSRRFAARSYATSRIKSIARRLNATANDIVLSLCGTALRHYLVEQRALPDRPLVACVPVSLRRDDSTDGNQISLALASLGTHLADPLARVAAVKASMDRNKAVFNSMSPRQLLAYSLAMISPGALTLLPGLGRHRVVANVVISHVPGPRKDMYWQGCRLDGVYPASLVLDGFALNITLVSRHDFIDVGILACRRTLPRVERLLTHIETALRELEEVLGLHADAAAEVHLPSVQTRCAA